jgi:hypothetical protein
MRFSGSPVAPNTFRLRIRSDMRGCLQSNVIGQSIGPLRCYERLLLGLDRANRWD